MNGNKNIMFRGATLSCILITIGLLYLSNSLTTSTTALMQITTYTPPAFICSAYCMYQINANHNLNALCTASYTSGNGFCTKCDPLLFLAIPSGGNFQCIPHLYNSEDAQIYTPLNYKFGYFSDTNAATWVNTGIYNAQGLNPHYAIRVRFGVYLHIFQHPDFIYPFRYSIDGTSYNYNQTLDKYWSPYDIITSPQLNHTNDNATLTFRLLDNGYPYNTVNTVTSCQYYQTNGNCYCYSTYYTYLSGGFCTGGTTCGPVSSASDCLGISRPAVGGCCSHRYIQVTDLLIFVAKCQKGCLKCSSSTVCVLCDSTNLYFRYPADHMCYLTCPQATYPNATILFLNSTTYNTPQFICDDCPITCLNCSNITFCTICYAYGRNQSFLYNNTCINPCINGYQGNYSTHICICPLDYYYEIVALLLCQPCAIQCVRCFGSSNLQCTYCQKGYYLTYGTTHCLLECPDGQYKNDLTRTCYLCDPSCTSCQTKSTLCTKCFFINPVKYLLGQQCLTWCPAGYSWNNITYRCDLCDYYTFSWQGKCVKFCPSMYLADNVNRSCIHLSQTSYTFNLSLISVSILSHGKLMKFQILAQDGLNNTSYEAIIKRSYHNVQVIYKDQMVGTFNPIRNLVSMSLPIKNLQYQNNRIIYYVTLPPNLDYRKSFQVVFLESIAGAQDIYYGNLTNTYPINQHPELMKQYYSYSIKNQYNAIMVAFVVIVLCLFALQLKGVYELYMELFRVLQLLGLLVYSAFPVGPYIFYFLIGCSYANLDFIPNLYALAAKPETIRNFSSYSMSVDDMDFIRLNGSVLFFAIIWTFVVIIAKYLLKIKESRLTYMVNFGVDLMEVKIMHSFWSSLVFIIINYTSTNFSVFTTFAFAFVLFLAILARRYAIWKESLDISPIFVWRLIATLLLCFISFANELLISLIFCISVGASLWQFYLLHSSKYLININNLNSSNYMNEKTYKILNNYDEEVKWCWSISVRNTLITMFPIATSLFMSILILMKESEYQAIIFTSVLIYFFMLVVIITSIFIYNFLQERRKYLVQNKLEFLQKKYAKLSNNDTIVYEQRRRPRITNSNNVFDEQKYLQQNPARSMMKNID